MPSKHPTHSPLGCWWGASVSSVGFVVVAREEIYWSVDVAAVISAALSTAFAMDSVTKVFASLGVAEATDFAMPAIPSASHKVVC